MNSHAPKGLVLNIQHFCTDDGPGIRTTVFLKFCSLRCKWCCNPESIHPKPELAYNMSKCIGAKACGRCLKPPCPEGAGAHQLGSLLRPHRREQDGVRLCQRTSSKHRHAGETGISPWLMDRPACRRRLPPAPPAYRLDESCAHACRHCGS